ncbi:unnamed protein product [Nippostrongylus brasiliensis]|uniref:Mediator of RNA polymerase II transcription subunit 22 n=1 Tax=Nippostrongylus brasiliensis TaxID=27835 RepID=A0A0N4XZK1_NIPBR|nr:hypothetical protein Q1695_002886 [Nippostrongylus brasiliensis]VDL72207.1 unnamed protein product [Nippostrongylus brasiliensis]
MIDCVFDCEMEPESYCKQSQFKDVDRSGDNLLEGLKSVLRKVYIAEAILFKRLESTSTAEEADHLYAGLTKLNEVESSLQLRILHHLSPISPCDSEQEE